MLSFLFLIRAVHASGTNAVSNPATLHLKKLCISVQELDIRLAFLKRKTTRTHFLLDKLADLPMVGSILMANCPPPRIEKLDPLASLS